MGKKSLVKTIDFTTPEALAELEKTDAEIKEARRLAEIKMAKEAEEKRKQEAFRDEELRKIMRDVNRKKFENNPPPFKPSRMIDIDSDVAIMNIETMVTAIKGSVDFLENKLWEIEDYLYRNDKKKRENLKLQKMKRNVRRQGVKQG